MVTDGHFVFRGITPRLLVSVKEKVLLARRPQTQNVRSVPFPGPFGTKAKRYKGLYRQPPPFLSIMCDAVAVEEEARRR